MRRWLAPADAVAQQLAWWGAVAGAASGAPWLSAAAAWAPPLMHLALRRGGRGWIAITAAAAAAYGFATDTLLVGAGFLTFGSDASSTATALEVAASSPVWMVGLWASFGAALTASLRSTLRWRPQTVVAAAAIAGPLAYRAGAALGALAFTGDAALGTAAVALQWAVGIPLLLAVARRAAAGAAEDAAGVPGDARDDRKVRGGARDNREVLDGGSYVRRESWRWAR